jgi:hypothetical protein
MQKACPAYSLVPKEFKPVLGEGITTKGEDGKERSSA